MAFRKMTRQEAGRLGGLATVRKHGRQHMSNIGRWGGCNLVEKHGAEHMAKIGSKGFQTYKDRHHGGNAERALFALKKGGKVQIDWRQSDFDWSGYCLKCDKPYLEVCPRCRRASTPF